MCINTRWSARRGLGAFAIGVGVFLGASTEVLVGQRGGRAGGGGRQGGAVESQQALPQQPTVVELPTLSAEVTGPGPIFDSAPSLVPGAGLARYEYETKEYFVSGTANGQPYTTRIVVRRPGPNGPFSGVVLAEAMHGSGAAHMFEYTSVYTMSSEHVALEILTTDPQQLIEHNSARYQTLKIAGGQASDILAQVGALVRSGEGPLAGLTVRRMVLAGTSMSAGTLLSYLPAHRVWRSPGMRPIYDGFLPTSTGAEVPDVDVPVVQVPTMNEIIADVTRRQDSDEPGRQFRLYEFAGMGHIDTRHNVRLQPNPCVQPTSRFPLEAYMSVALHHLIQWIDRGVVPPRAPRVLVDRDESGDGSVMALDEHGNPRGGIRNPYVDVPIASYRPHNTAVEPLIANASAQVRRRGATQICRLGAYEQAFAPAKLRELYRRPEDYVTRVRQKVDELERAGWSLPVYRALILADASAVNFQ